MLTSPNERQARCYQMLREPAFEPLIQQWMDERFKLMEHLSVTPDDILVRQLQGKIQILSDLIKSVVEANDVVKKVVRR